LVTGTGDHDGRRSGADGGSVREKRMRRRNARGNGMQGLALGELRAASSLNSAIPAAVMIEKSCSRTALTRNLFGNSDGGMRN
jgi:hypothetical protein